MIDTWRSKEGAGKPPEQHETAFCNESSRFTMTVLTKNSGRSAQRMADLNKMKGDKMI